MKKKESEKNRNGMSRRGFLQLMGAGAVASGAQGAFSAEPTAETAEPAELTRIRLLVNGRRHRLTVEPRWSLLFVLREKLGLTGTKAGCERGECGACTVLVGGTPRYACQTLAVEVEGAEITTVEGLLEGESLGPVQRAFVEKDGTQCGFCTPGQVMTVEGLLRTVPDPTPEQIREALSGNLCRCGAYAQIVRSARRAAELKRGGK